MGGREQGWNWNAAAPAGDGGGRRRRLLPPASHRFPGWKGELPATAEAVVEDGTVGFGELGKVGATEFVEACEVGHRPRWAPLVAAGGSAP